MVGCAGLSGLAGFTGLLALAGLVWWISLVDRASMMEVSNVEKLLGGWSGFSVWTEARISKLLFSDIFGFGDLFSEAMVRIADGNGHGLWCVSLSDCIGLDARGRDGLSWLGWITDV